MKKTMRIILPIILVIAIILCMVWYLFIYDRAFARDMLLSCARFSEERGNFNVSAWFYNRAYDLADGDSASKDQVAIELAEQYKHANNYTKAEYTLTKAIADGGGIDLYIALCKTYIEQDKLFDAVNMLDNVTDPEIKAQLEKMRPKTPTLSPDSGLYNQFISVSVTGYSGTLYAASGGVYPSIKGAPYSEAIPLIEGENIVYALSVSEDGIVSSLAVGTYTIGGVIKEVVFVDSAVEAEIRNLLNVSADRVLYNNELWKITEFTVPAEAKSYDDLQHLAFLTSLTLEDGVTADLSCLANMPNLETLTIKNTVVNKEAVDAIGTMIHLTDLTLQGCSISNISALKGAVLVVNLDLSHNSIADVSALSSMIHLETVNLEHNVVTEISSMSALSGLKTLDISNNVITSLAPISSLSSLTWVDAGNNNISELGNLSDLSSLEYLCLTTNKLSNVSALANCKALTELDISKNSITDISKLSALTNMMYFNFSYNQVTALPVFPTSCALVTINGSYNNLSSLDALAGLENLNNVHMDYNAEITSVDALASCYKLIEVNIYGTKVTSVRKLTEMSVIVNYNPT